MAILHLRYCEECQSCCNASLSSGQANYRLIIQILVVIFLSSVRQHKKWREQCRLMTLLKSSDHFTVPLSQWMPSHQTYIEHSNGRLLLDIQCTPCYSYFPSPATQWLTPDFHHDIYISSSSFDFSKCRIRANSMSLFSLATYTPPAVSLCFSNIPYSRISNSLSPQVSFLVCMHQTKIDSTIYKKIIIQLTWRITSPLVRRERSFPRFFPRLWLHFQLRCRVLNSK